MINYCPGCGEELNDKKCIKCNISSININQVPHNYCVNCGSPKLYSDKPCMNCGFALRRSNFDLNKTSSLFPKVLKYAFISLLIILLCFSSLVIKKQFKVISALQSENQWLRTENDRLITEVNQYQEKIAVIEEEEMREKAQEDLKKVITAGTACASGDLFACIGALFVP